MDGSVLFKDDRDGMTLPSLFPWSFPMKPPIKMVRRKHSRSFFCRSLSLKLSILCFRFTMLEFWKSFSKPKLETPSEEDMDHSSDIMDRGTSAQPSYSVSAFPSTSPSGLDHSHAQCWGARENDRMICFCESQVSRHKVWTEKWNEMAGTESERNNKSSLRPVHTVEEFSIIVIQVILQSYFRPRAHLFPKKSYSSTTWQISLFG